MNRSTSNPVQRSYDAICRWCENDFESRHDFLAAYCECDPQQLSLLKATIVDRVVPSAGGSLKFQHKVAEVIVQASQCQVQFWWRQMAVLVCILPEELIHDFWSYAFVGDRFQALSLSEDSNIFLDALLQTFGMLAVITTIRLTNRHSTAV